MDMNSVVSFGWIAGLAGLIFGIYQWKNANDAKVDREGQFKGIVNTKLDTIINDAKENARQHQELYEKHHNHETRIQILEEAKRSKQKKLVDET